MSNPPLDDSAATMYVKKTITLHPEKYGVWGSYSREMLECAPVDGQARMFDQLAYQLTTAVLCSRTVSEAPEVVLSLPASPWQHLKHSLDWWVSDKNEHWEGRHPETGEAVTPHPFLFLLWPILVLFPKFIKSRPIRYTTVNQVHFEQRVLYPEINMPASAGRPVIYETADITWPDGFGPFGGGSLIAGPSRFLNRHEIAREMFRDPDAQRYGVSLGPDQALRWLEKHGVNVDQLVKRR